MNLSKAMLKIGSLTADKKNKHDNYDYISADKILQRVGEMLGSLNVVVIPGITNVSIEQYQWESRGETKSMFSAIVDMTMRVIDGENEYEVSWAGAGVDYRVPDKAVNKAITSGHKYFLAKMLMIGIGNEDGDHDVPEAPVETPKQMPKPERPYDAVSCKAKILEVANKYRLKKATTSDAQNKAFVITYDSLWGGVKESRYAVTKWIFGKASSKDLGDVEKLALIKWMDWEEIPEGGYIPSQDAMSEAQIMLRYVEKEQGQQELL